MSSSFLSRAALAGSLFLVPSSLSAPPAEAAPVKGYECRIDFRAAAGGMHIDGKKYFFNMWHRHRIGFNMGARVNDSPTLPAPVKRQFHGKAVSNIAQAEVLCDQMKNAVLKLITPAPRSATAKVTPRTFR